MPTPPKPNPRPSRDPHTALRAMCIAALVGSTVASVLPLATPIARLTPALALIISAGFGFGAALIFLPWNLLHTWSQERATLRRLTRRLREYSNSDGRASVRSLLLDRDDDLGELAEAIHDVASAAASTRLQKSVLHRSMNDVIRRETDRAVTVLRQQAETDPLTGIGNRRTLDRLLAKLFDGSNDGLTISAVAIDLDRFKAVNDHLGHEVGDECLAFLGELLRSCLRREDTPIRLGGDEFLIIMPDMTPKSAKSVADRLASLFAQMPWDHALQRPTLSIGIASVTTSDTGAAAELLRCADASMYASKRNGRAKVTPTSEQSAAAENSAAPPTIAHKRSA